MKISTIFPKALMLSLGAMIAVLGFAQVSLAAGAHEGDPIPCYDITGVTTGLNVDGVPNGGIMDFGDAAVGAGFQACVRMSNGNPGAVPDHLEGWVWNSNLGWISLYCPGGVGAKNLGADCGTVNYHVDLVVTGAAPNFDSVKMTGYAWGDNIGYISFDDPAGTDFFQTKVVASGANRGLIDATLLPAGYHAWADAVGWLDLRGMRLNWSVSVPDPNVLARTRACSSVDPVCQCNFMGGCQNPQWVPDADGTEKYTIKIPFVDGGVNIEDDQIEECPSDPISMKEPAPNGKPYCAKIGLKWVDDVDKDQTDLVSQSQDNPKYNEINNGAVKKPLTEGGSFGADSFVYNPGDVLWGADVTSVAPTSERNVTDGMQNEMFYYADNATFGGGQNDYKTDKIDQNKLILKQMNLMFFKYSEDGVTDGVCIYGEVVDGKCGMKNYLGAGVVVFGFNPLVEVKTLAYMNGSKPINFINASSIDNKQEFKEQVKTNDAAIEPVTNFYIGFENGGVFSIKWVTDFLTATKEDQNSLSFKQSSDDAVNFWVAKIFQDALADKISTDAGPYVYTKTTYKVGDDEIAYYGAKLPRVKAGLLFNPVAKVEGNVYVTDFAQKAAEVNLKSLGNIASNLRREAVVRNVAKYLAGKSGQLVNTLQTISDTSHLNGLTELVKDKVYYLKGNDLTFECNGGCTFDKNVTFIVDNGNIFVNSDILTKDKAQVGLIALRDLKTNAQDKGFLYLSKNVGWLQNVQIYLDRVVQSYDPTGPVAFDPNGFAKTAGDDYARQEKFNNQLVIEGTISSMNGVGNASRALPVYETGKVISPTDNVCDNYSPDANLGRICRARVTDLNYLRYYGPGLVLCKGDEGGNAVANIPQDQTLKDVEGADGGCNPSYSSDGVIYEINAKELAPQGDLVAGGGSGKQSQYFIIKNLPATLQNEYPVNFFYKPISKDLKGFEVDQSFTPVSR